LYEITLLNYENSWTRSLMLLLKKDVSSEFRDITSALLFLMLLFCEGCDLKDVALSKTSVGVVEKN